MEPTYAFFIGPAFGSGLGDLSLVLRHDGSGDREYVLMVREKYEEPRVVGGGVGKYVGGNLCKDLKEGGYDKGGRERRVGIKEWTVGRPVVRWSCFCGA